MALMLYYDLYISAGEYDSLQLMFNRLSEDEFFADEVCQLTEILMSRCNALEQDDNSAFRDSFPLKLHGVYTKAQIQVAIETSTLQKMSPSREGCERNTLNGIPMEAMFVDVYLGKVTLDSFECNKPMQIVWNLKTPMPGSVYEYAATLANV